MTNTVIEMQNVAVKFGEFQVHHDINFKIKRAEVVSLLGPSGAGKTVLFRLIIGLLAPTSGRVSVLDQDLSALDEDQMIKLRMNIGMLFQGAALFDSMSIFDNVAYALRESNSYNEEQISEIVHDKLNIIGLPNIAAKFPPQLSGGQKKRVGLARALASSPKVILFDEPTTGLDPTTRRLIDELIVRLRDEYEITSLLITHDIESARRVSDRWLLLNQGRIIADGLVKQLAETNKDIIKFTSGYWDENNAA